MSQKSLSNHQVGVIHYLLLIAALGIIVFLLISSSAPFKDKLFSLLFPKPSSYAAELTRDLTNQLLKGAKEYSLARGDQKAEVLSKLKEVALRRKEIMEEDIKKEPEVFLLNTLSPKLKNRLPKEIAELVESQIVVEGPLDIEIAENFEAQKSEKFHKIDKYTLHFVRGDPMDKISKLIDKSGNKFKVTGFGYLADIVVDFSSDTSLESSPTSTKGKRKISGASAITGPRKAAAILFNFLDNSQTPFSGGEVANTLFDTNPGVRSLTNYYADNSYNEISFSGVVYDWVSIDVKSSDGCNQNNWANLANSKAKEKYGFNYNNYDHVLYILPKVSVCNWSGFGQVGILSSQGNTLGKNTFYNGYNDIGVYAHEIGHNLGLEHAALKSCTSSTRQTDCDVAEYGDSLDPLGRAVPVFAHLNDMHENKLGWLDVQKAVNKKIYDIYPLADQAARSNNLLQVLRIDKGPTYFVSYYQPIGFDKNLPNNNPLVVNNSQGVVIHSGQSYPKSDSLLMLLPEMKALSQSSSGFTLLDNGIFYDEGNGVEIKQLSHDSSKATVQVTLTNGSCVGFPPLLSVQTPDGLPGTSYPGGFVNYIVTVTNNDSSACSPASFNLLSTVPDGWQSSFSPTSVTLSPGQSTTSTWTVRSKSDSPDNIYNINATAQNQSDTNLKSTVTTSLLVSSTLTPPSTCSDTNLTCTFGKTNIGSTRDPIGSNQWGSKAELSADGDVSAINAYLEWDGDGSDLIKALIYDNIHDSDNNTDTPGSLVAESATGTFSSTPSWVRLSFDSLVALPKGTYWLSVLGEEAGVYGYYNDDGSSLTYYKDDAAWSPPDDPAQVTSTQERVYSIYADYSLGSGLPKPSPTPTPSSGSDSIKIMNAKLPTGKIFLSCAGNSSTHKIYCFGGEFGGTQIVEYNSSLDQLTIKSAKLPDDRFALSCAENSFTHKIYCFGGYTSTGILIDQIIEYDSALDQTVIKSAKLPSPRYKLSCAENSSTHKIYCFGGQTNNTSQLVSSTDQIIEYDPSLDQLTIKSAKLPGEGANLNSHSCVEESSTHKIYCFTYNQIVEYDPAADQPPSIKTANLPIARHELSCSENSTTHKIYCFGGYNGGLQIYFDQIVEYNSPLDQTVIKSAKLPGGRRGLSCAENSTTHKIYCFGGANNSYFDQIVEYTP